MKLEAPIPSNAKKLRVFLLKNVAAVKLISGVLFILCLLSVPAYKAFRLKSSVSMPTIVTFDNPSWGDLGSRVKVVEFSNFTCTHCAVFSGLLAGEIKEKYGGKVLFVHKDFPFDKEGVAFKAAVFARCAQQQGKFWEVNKLLYSEQSALVKNENIDALFETIGAKVKADKARLNSCYQQQATAPLVEKDINEARGLGLERTPIFFINKVVATTKSLDAVIAQELVRTAGQ